MLSVAMKITMLVKTKHKHYATTNCPWLEPWNGEKIIKTEIPKT
jgi:hypothetical protein